MLLGGKGEYPATKRLYFGYAHEAKSLRGFVRAVVAIERIYKKGEQGVKPVDICLPAHKLGRNLNETRDWLEHIQGTSIELYWRGESGDKPTRKTVQVSKGSNNDIPIRIVQLPFLSHRDFLTMLTASEPMSLCTGDQSLIESMCAGKVLIYDTPSHKHHLYTDLIGMCEVKSCIEAPAS